jgi:hypothetical protein
VAQHDVSAFTNKCKCGMVRSLRPRPMTHVTSAAPLLGDIILCIHINIITQKPKKQGTFLLVSWHCVVLPPFQFLFGIIFSSPLTFYNIFNSTSKFK